jgi:uncharacterized membrane protein YkvA (DUF1232 family)
MIKLPLRVGDDLRERIEKSYADAIRQVGEAEDSYVRSKLPGVLANLGRGSQDWRSEVAVTASAIFKAYENPENADAFIGESRPMLLAALFYLCNPYDIIPDRVPSTGFVDDAVVLNNCVQRIEHEAPELHRQISASLAKPGR